MATIKVENLSKGTSNVTLEQFFSFCGKISNVERSEGDSSAVIHFVKESAAKTALLLDGGSLDGAALRVSSDDVAAPEHAQPTLSNDSAAKPVQETREPLSGPGPVEGEDAGVTQEDKPRSAIAAEYLAHGWLLSDAVVEKLISADKAHGISSRFLAFFNPLAEKAQPSIDTASKKLQEFDQQRGISVKASAATQVGLKYYEQALNSKWGAKVHEFYTKAQKEVLDVHAEAARIRESKKAASGTASPTGETATTESTPATAAAPEVK